MVAVKADWKAAWWVVQKAVLWAADLVENWASQKAVGMVEPSVLDWVVLSAVQKADKTVVVKAGCSVACSAVWKVFHSVECLAEPLVARSVVH